MEHPEWMEQVCSVCETKPKMYKKAGNYRNTVIGKVCPDCYPTYKKIHKLLSKQYNELLHEVISNSINQNINYHILWKDK